MAYTKADVIEYMGVITEHVDMDHPVLLDKYILGTECEVDAICDGENFLIPGIMEQVERTGVHSGVHDPAGPGPGNLDRGTF